MFALALVLIPIGALINNGLTGLGNALIMDGIILVLASCVNFIAKYMDE